MRADVFGAPIDVIDLSEGIDRVHQWGNSHQSKAINFCNVHSVVTARESAEFAEVLRRGDLNFPDGGPVAAWIRKKTKGSQKRVSGPDFMLQYLEAARRWSERIYLYGGTQQILDNLEAELKNRFPWVDIVGKYSPPFNSEAHIESIEQIEKINDSGANTLWVSLGCPKQETWLSLHHGKIDCAMLGVGAAFPLISGDIPRAPKWMRENSLEWLYRLWKEPKRLFNRYLNTNLKFVLLWIKNAWIN